MRNIEQELKLALDEREYGLILALANDAVTLKQTNYYFGGGEPKKDALVRLRETDVWRLEYKKRISENGGVFVSEEKGGEVTRALAERFIRSGVSVSELKKITGALFGDDGETLKCLGQLVTYRTSFVYAGMNLELDKNEYLGVTDYELECESVRSEALDELKSNLVYETGISVKTSRPKSARFYDRLCETMSGSDLL